MPTPSFKLKPLNRKSVCPPYQIKGSDVKIRFFIALPEDYDIILDFHVQVAYELKPVGLGAKVTREAYRREYTKSIRDDLDQPFTIVAVNEENEICGMVTGTIRQLNKNRVKKPVIFEDDYGKALEKYNGPDESTRLVNCFFSEIQSFVPNFIPDSCNEFMKIGGLIVIPEMQRLGLASKLWLELLKLAKEANFEYVISCSASPASIRIAEKFGMKAMITYKYGDFKCNGIKVFPDVLADGATELKLMVGNLKDMSEF